MKALLGLNILLDSMIFYYLYRENTKSELRPYPYYVPFGSH
jgi:hypothetical protein